MESQHDGKTNPVYTNGSVNIQDSLDPIKDTQNGYAARGKQFDRMYSTVSTTGTNSVLKLVVDESVEIRHCKGRMKYVTYILLVLLVVGIAVMSTLYTIEMKKNKEDKKIQKKVQTIDKHVACFDRVEARKMSLKSLLNESEIITAKLESTLQIFGTKEYSEYHAFSVTVNYMGEELWSINGGKMNYTDKSSHKPTEDTKYPVASITKLFTILMLEMLVENGTIKSVDDDVSIYEPSLQLKDASGKQKKITFRQLACMMSGIRRESPCYPYKETNYCPYSNEEMLQRINNLTLIKQHPDLSPSYSNLGVALLGRIMERQLKTNETYEQWITRNILRPLNMTNTGFDVISKAKEIPVSTVEGGGRAPFIKWGWNAPTGGIYSSVADLGKLAKIFTMKKNPILPEKNIKRLLKPEFTWSDGNSQGCPFEISNGIKINPQSDDKYKVEYMVYEKGGAIFGYGSLFAIVPEMKLNINAIVANTEGPARVYGIVVRNFLKAFHNLLKRKKKQYKLPPNPEFFVGTYKQVTDWPLIYKPATVKLIDGTLYLNIQWFNTPLTHYRGTTLQSKNYKGPCNLFAVGLLEDRYYFERNDTLFPDKASGFYVNGLSSYGFVRFARIE